MVVTTGREMLSRLVRQVTASVRWDLCMQTMAEIGVTAIVELAPAGTLAGRRHARHTARFSGSSSFAENHTQQTCHVPHRAGLPNYQTP